MDFFAYGILLTVGLSVWTTGSLADVCDWKIDWNDNNVLNISGLIDPFERPEFFHSQIDLMGRLWNAKTMQEATGYVCLEYGPSIYSSTSEEEIRTKCNDVVESLRKNERFNILDDCRKLWAHFGLDQDLSENVEYYLEECVDVNAGLSPTALELGNPSCDPNVFLANNVISIVERISVIVFEVLDWLGPSPFSGDVFGACSLVRSMLAMKNEDILQHLTEILTYPVADVLEALRIYDACSSTDTNIQDFLTAVDQLQLVDISICDFLSAQPSREQYLEASRKLLVKTLYLPTDEALCTDLFVILSEAVTNETLYSVFGSDLSSSEKSRQFCTDVALAFDPNSKYSPVMYIFPEDQNVDTWTAFSLPGQIIPNFSVLDAAELLAAIGQPETLAEGVSVFCSVFESFLDETTSTTLPNQLCSATRNGDLEEVEELCLELTVPVTIGTSYPISLRKPTAIYMGVIGLNMLRTLFTLQAISRIEVCRAVDEFYHSGHSVQSLVTFMLESYYTEMLPIANDICNDYDNVILHLRNTSSLDSATFDEVVAVATTGLLAHLGFSSREELCTTIADGIDTQSGRPTDSLVSKMVTESLRFLTDVDRCQDTKKTIDVLADVPFDVGSLNMDLTGTLGIYIALNQSTDLCNEMTKAFSGSRSDLCAVDFHEDDPPPPTGFATLHNVSLFLLGVLSSLWMLFYH